MDCFACGLKDCYTSVDPKVFKYALCKNCCLILEQIDLYYNHYLSGKGNAFSNPEPVKKVKQRCIENQIDSIKHLYQKLTVNFKDGSETDIVFIGQDSFASTAPCNDGSIRSSKLGISNTKYPFLLTRNSIKKLSYKISNILWHVTQTYNDGDKISLEDKTINYVTLNGIVHKNKIYFSAISSESVVDFLVPGAKIEYVEKDGIPKTSYFDPNRKYCYINISDVFYENIIKRNLCKGVDMFIGDEVELRLQNSSICNAIYVGDNMFYVKNPSEQSKALLDTFTSKTLPFSRLDNKVKDLGLNPEDKNFVVLSALTVINKINKRGTFKMNNNGNNTFFEMFKHDAKEAGYRVASTQVSKAVKSAILMVFKDKGADESKLGIVRELLDTPIGEAMISYALGQGLNYVPGLKNDPRVNKLAGEFRINGMANAGNEIMGVATKYFLPAIQDALKALPSVSETEVENTSTSEKEELVTENKKTNTSI